MVSERTLRARARLQRARSERLSREFRSRSRARGETEARQRARSLGISLERARELVSGSEKRVALARAEGAARRKEQLTQEQFKLLVEERRISDVSVRTSKGATTQTGFLATPTAVPVADVERGRRGAIVSTIPERQVIEGKPSRIFGRIAEEQARLRGEAPKPTFLQSVFTPFQVTKPTKTGFIAGQVLEEPAKILDRALEVGGRGLEAAVKAAGLSGKVDIGISKRKGAFVRLREAIIIEKALGRKGGKVLLKSDVTDVSKTAAKAALFLIPATFPFVGGAEVSRTTGRAVAGKGITPVEAVSTALIGAGLAARGVKALTTPIKIVRQPVPVAKATAIDFIKPTKVLGKQGAVSKFILKVKVPKRTGTFTTRLRQILGKGSKEFTISKAREFGIAPAEKIVTRGGRIIGRPEVIVAREGARTAKIVKLVGAQGKREAATTMEKFLLGRVTKGKLPKSIRTDIGGLEAAQTAKVKLTSQKFTADTLSKIITGKFKVKGFQKTFLKSPLKTTRTDQIALSKKLKTDLKDVEIFRTLAVQKDTTLPIARATGKTQAIKGISFIFKPRPKPSDVGFILPSVNKAARGGFRSLQITKPLVKRVPSLATAKALRVSKGIQITAQKQIPRASVKSFAQATKLKTIALQKTETALRTASLSALIPRQRLRAAQALGLPQRLKLKTPSLLKVSVTQAIRQRQRAAQRLAFKVPSFPVAPITPVTPRVPPGRIPTKDITIPRLPILKGKPLVRFPGKKKKRKGEFAFLTAGFTARALGLKPIKLKKLELFPEVKRRAKSIGIRSRVVIRLFFYTFSIHSL